MRFARLRWCTLGAALLACLAAAHAQVTTAPPQPVTTPPPPPAWRLVRPAPPPVPASAETSAVKPATPAAGKPTPKVETVAPTATIPAPEAAHTPGPAAISLGAFLHQTLGRVSNQPTIVMPGIPVQSLSVSGDLMQAGLENLQDLVQIVLENLGLELVQSSGVWVVQMRRGAVRPENHLETWVYSPRNRPILSLAPYFQTFPRLSFHYSGGAGGPYPSVRQPEPFGSTASGASFMGPATNAAGTQTDANAWAAGAASANPMTYGSSMGAGGGWGGGGWGSGGWGGSGWGSSPGLGAAAFNTQPFSGSAAAISDPSLLVVRGHPRDIAQFRDFLDKVDLPVPEVQLRVYVLEVRDQDNRDSAVQLLLNLLGGQFTGSVGGAPGDTNRLFLGGRDISLAISRLTTDSRVRLISSPTLRAADGSTASVTIGTDTPTLGSIVTFSGAVQQSVAYQSAGVLLNVSPNILNESIRLMIWQELSSFAKTETGLSTTPTKLRRAFRTDVVARSGEVLMLGGLSESSQIDLRQRSFFGLGSRSTENMSSEIVVLLQVIRL